jgi:hypothetical protein
MQIGFCDYFIEDEEFARCDVSAVIPPAQLRRSEGLCTA